ncbi:hypothetical protein [Henriciella aquimarina]|uniref:hypothetical protein n=1 Tax=Henriciella aquimarina TaxID=545261 RepID=UPI000A05BD1F|nr:hypothetical protein [Henriciella aquimarina]
MDEIGQAVAYLVKCNESRSKIAQVFGVVVGAIITVLVGAVFSSDLSISFFGSLFLVIAVVCYVLSFILFGLLFFINMERVAAVNGIAGNLFFLQTLGDNTQPKVDVESEEYRTLKEKLFERLAKEVQATWSDEGEDRVMIFGGGLFFAGIVFTAICMICLMIGL